MAGLKVKNVAMLHASKSLNDARKRVIFLWFPYYIVLLKLKWCAQTRHLFMVSILYSSSQTWTYTPKAHALLV